jgi:hypothetical protein
MKPRLLVIPAIIAAFSAAVIWASLQLELSPPMIVGEGMQPRAFPIFLMVINLLLVLILAVQLQREGPQRTSRQPYATWGSVVLLGVFYVLTVTLDMFIGIAVVMFLMCLLWGERRVHVAATLALVAPLSIFILFDSVLKVRFPRGILMDWYYG